MKKLAIKVLSLFLFLGFCQNAHTTGWPAYYEGVMLQGFYWDSNNETSWKQLTSMSDELSRYFSLIWVPNSAQSGGYPAMGYMPMYWFSNHNSSFGTETELKTMINTYKAKGVGIIEDVVLNHRVGVTNWYDFPSETWRGKTYRMTDGAICSTDEMWKQGGHGCPYRQGNADTGDDFDGGRDLDHTNSTVQEHSKDYCKFLLEELGYVGFRLDMVKGFRGEYTKMYNQYSKPQFCVGEYFDGSYDKVAAWIESTGRESAAFDFPFKFAVNDAFHSGDMTKLCWKANYVTDQPAGLIHFGYPQFAVTFLDNHDTYRDQNKLNNDVEAAYAFMLCSPGTPCVFWPHYKQYKAAIQKLIEIRNKYGIHNMSSVNVLRLQNDCYMAEVTGTKGKIVVKVGSAWVSPDNYSDSQIVTYGNNYCVWATEQGGNNPTQPFTVYFRNDVNWSNPHIHYWGQSESSWPGVKMSNHYGNVWKYTVPAGTTGLLFNAGDGNPTKTSDFTAIPDHLYTTNGDQGVYQDITPSYPQTLYLIGNVEGAAWNTAKGTPSTGTEGIYSYQVKIDDTDGGYGYFAFATKLGSTWEVVNSGDRFGATSADLFISSGQTLPIVKYAVNVNAAESKSWKIQSGTYSVVADLAKMQLTVSRTTDRPVIEADENNDCEIEYYNIQGIKVENVTKGLYIKRLGDKVTKVYVP